MIRSAAEIRAEVQKAARGVGLPLGLAEELSMMSEGLDAAALSRLIKDLANPEAKEVVAQQALEHALRPSPIEVLPPRDVSEADWLALSQMAACTYVPETAESRASGAGASNIDND